MSSTVEKTLEYDKLQDLLKTYTVSQLGAARVDTLVPRDNIDEVQYLQTLCSEAKNLHQCSSGIPLAGLRDIRGPLGRAAKIGAVLEPDELLEIRRILQIPGDIHRLFEKRNREEFPQLFGLVETLPTFPSLMDAIDHCINPEGTVLDRASPKLRTLRRKLASLRQRIHQKLEDTLRSAEHQRAIQEPVVTSRNDRYVIPIKQEARTSFQGVVQAQSTSGATFFVEPLAVVQMNNQLHETAGAEHREIRCILLKLTDEIRSYLHELELAVDILGELDFLNAKARLSLALNAVEPKLNTSGVVRLIQARHPLLEFHLRQKRKNPREGQDIEQLPTHVVPTNIHIGETFKTLIITGPNTGGKTVVLKTIGLLTLMAQAGLHIPAENGSQISVCDHVFADIGDDQAIEQNLSTFSSHITKIAEMLKTVKHASCSLVLLDEIGAGTDPGEGAALAMALLDWLNKKPATTIATTHYGALKAYAHAQQRMENASMEFDCATLQPTYRLQLGVPGSSNAIKIAAQLGIPLEILDEAQTYLGNNNVAVEELLVRLRETQTALNTERELLKVKIQNAETARQEHTDFLETSATERQRIKEQAEDEAREIVTNARRTIENLIADIRKTQASKTSIQKAFSKIEAIQKSLQHKPSEEQPQQPGIEVKVGDKVRVKQFNRFGEVTAVRTNHKKPLQILVGTLQMEAGYNEIDSVHPQQQSVRLSTSVLEIQYEKTNTVKDELNIHGMFVKEALHVTAKYLDDAYLAGFSKVRILHGKGTGALRQAVHQELAENLHVEKYQFAPFNQGGEGVTVVTFKE